MNWREIDRVLVELDLSGAFIRDVAQPEPATLCFSLYRPRGKERDRGPSRLTLLCCFAAGASRMYRTAVPFAASPPPAPRFVSFLRAHVRGSRIASALQLGTERIVRIACGAGERRRVIWVRLWSGASNCLVTDDRGVILEPLFRRPQRGEVAGSRYDPSVGLKARPDPERYRLRDLTGAGDYNARLDADYREQEANELAERDMRAAHRRFETDGARLATRIARLQAARSHAGDYERLRAAGQAILAEAHALQRSAAELLPAGGDPIALIPGLSPAENARRYFDRYRRQRAAFEHIQADLIDTRRRLQALRAHGHEPFLAAAAAPAPRQPPRQPPRTPASGPGNRYDSGGWVLRVGRSASANDAILRHAAGGNDYWFHCRDHAGAHVFLSARRGKSPPLEILLDAANLALFFSKARRNAQADIHYTQVKNLRRIKGGAPGAVLPVREKNLFIRLDQERLNRLLGGDRSERSRAAMSPGPAQERYSSNG